MHDTTTAGIAHAAPLLENWLQSGTLANKKATGAYGYERQHGAMPPNH